MSEIPILLLEPQPPIAKRNGFQLRNRVFSVDNIERVRGSRLYELFNPSTLRHPRDQRDTEKEAQKLFKKAFFAAQLRFYGIPFKSSFNKPHLQFLLQDAIRQGKCSRVPQSVKELEASMRVDYEPVQKKWEAAHAAWRAEKKRRDNEAFKLSRTPSERAALDPERFLAMYFLTDGRPDATKVRKALALHNVQNVRKFEKMAKKTVPGLYTWNGPDRFASNVYIGWDIDEVVDLGMRTSKDEEKANKAQQKALWEQQLERHREYVAQARVGEPSKGPKKHPEGFSLDRCKGSYVIHCKETTEEYLSILKGHTLTMDIWSRDETTLCAAFDFGILEGTMILGMTEDLLKDDPFESDQDLEARFSDEDVDEIDPEEEIRRFQISANRRKRKATEAELAELAAKRQAKEMRRAAEPVPEFLQRRVYFRLRSRLTAVGDINPAPEAGHLDFRSDDCVEFSGRVYLLSWIGKNVWFRGHKVSDTPRVEPEDWSSFPIKSGFKYIQSDVKNL